VLLDLAMPRMNGVQAARRIAREVPAAKVVILSSHSDGQHLRQAVEAGVAGFVTKETAGEDLLEAIRSAERGTAFYSPLVLKHLLKQPAKHSAPLAALKRGSGLSWRQAELTQLISKNHGTKQIADLLSISVKTAERHR
jgi:DNA-binding NarL/FixJ family response regulator